VLEPSPILTPAFTPAPTLTQLEIEPGTFLTANSGALLTTVQDMTTTGSEGHSFLKLDSGMTDVLRPSLYGSQHPIVGLKPPVPSANADSASASVGAGAGEGNGISTSESATKDYIIVGHCCESGDLFSCAPGDGDSLKARKLPIMQIGDLISIEGAGAYCSSMSTKNYNSFPEAPEVMIDVSGMVHLIRRRQTLEQMLVNEIPYQG